MKKIKMPLTESILKQLDGSILPSSIITFIEEKGCNVSGVGTITRERIHRADELCDELLIEFWDGSLSEIMSSKNTNIPK